MSPIEDDMRHEEGFRDLADPFPYDSLVPETLRRREATDLVEDATSHLGLMYAAELGWRPLRLDLHVPRPPARPAPIVIYVHGGSFVGGVPDMGPWTRLPGCGVAVAAITYRLAAEAPFPESVEDVRAAVRWTRRHAHHWGLDPTRVALWASSAGALIGSIAALAGDGPDVGRRLGDDDVSARVDAVVNHYPLTDVPHLRDDAISGGEEAAERLTLILDRYAAGSTSAASILDHVRIDGEPPPFLTLHGTADTRVGPRQAARLHTALTEAGGESTLRMLEGAGHGTEHFYAEKTSAEVLAFLHDIWARNGAA